MNSHGLRGLNIAPQDLGGSSPLAFPHVVNLAERGFVLFPSHGEQSAKGAKEAATSDIETLRDLYIADPACDWRARCGREDGLYVLNFPRDRDQLWCEQEFGPLPSTWLVTRPSGGTQFWFRTSAESGDPDLKAVRVRATRAAILSSTPVPGSTHRASQERHQWVRNCSPGTCALARLPDPWLMQLPRKGDVSITALPVLRPEFIGRTGRLPEQWR